MSTNELPDGLQQTGVNSPFNACMYRDDCRSEHAQRLTLQHHACDLAQRVADLEQARKERDDLRAWKDAVEAREPAIVEAGELRVGFGDTEEAVWLKLSRNIPLGTELFTHPAPAQAVPESVAGLVSVFCYDEVLTFTFCDEAAADNFAGRFDPSVDSAAAPEHKA